MKSTRSIAPDYAAQAKDANGADVGMSLAQLQGYLARKATTMPVGDALVAQIPSLLLSIAAAALTMNAGMLNYHEQYMSKRGLLADDEIEQVDARRAVIVRHRTLDADLAERVDYI